MFQVDTWYWGGEILNYFLTSYKSLQILIKTVDF